MTSVEDSMKERPKKILRRDFITYSSCTRASRVICYLVAHGTRSTGQTVPRRRLPYDVLLYIMQVRTVRPGVGVWD